MQENAKVAEFSPISPMNDDSEFVWPSATAAKDTSVIFGGSTPPGS